MEKYFINPEFESAMCFLVDVVDECIEKKMYGFFNKKNEHFSVHFCYVGLKSKVIKRKAEVSKLSVSLENLLLVSGELMAKDDYDLTISTASAKRIKIEEIPNLPSVSCFRKGPGVVVDVNQLEKRIKVEGDSNLSGVSGCRKRTVGEVDYIKNEKPPMKKFRKRNI